MAFAFKVCGLKKFGFWDADYIGILMKPNEKYE